MPKLSDEDLKKAIRDSRRSQARVGARILIRRDAPCQFVLGFSTGNAAHDDGVFAVAFEPDGDSQKGVALLWETQAGLYDDMAKMTPGQWVVYESAYHPPASIFG